MEKKTSLYVATGEAIRGLRLQHGLTQKQLAQSAGLHVNSIKSLERRIIVSRESSHSLAQVAKALREHGLSIPDEWFNWRRWGPKSGGMVRASVQMLRNPDPAPAVIRPRSCGAKTRRGTPCQRPPLKNGKCKFHGGMSTGPRTLEGRQRIAEAQRRRWANLGRGAVHTIPRSNLADF